MSARSGIQDVTVCIHVDISPLRTVVEKAKVLPTN